MYAPLLMRETKGPLPDNGYVGSDTLPPSSPADQSKDSIDSAVAS